MLAPDRVRCRPLDEGRFHWPTAAELPKEVGGEAPMLLVPEEKPSCEGVEETFEAELSVLLTVLLRVR